jgi:hypothetical protein
VSDGVSEDSGEPAGDPLQRLAVGLAGLGLLAALLPVLGLGHPLRAGAHARAVAFGVFGVFVLGFLARILPRARGAPLARPALARGGLLLWTLGAVVEGVGAAPEEACALIWGAGAVALAASFGPTLAAGARERAWFEGWVAAGLLGMALASAGLVAGLLGVPGLADRAAGAFLAGGAAPITLGLTVRMLPPLAGIGPPDRARAARAGRFAPPVAALIAGSLLAGRTGIGGAGLLGLGLAAVASLRGLRERGDGSEAQAAARRERAPTVLRNGARVAFASGALGALLVILGGSDPRWRSAGLHGVGLGFLAGIASGVAQRVVPGFVRGELRWPRLASAAPILLTLALSIRWAAVIAPRLLPAAACTLLAAWAVFALQVGPSLRRPSTASRAKSPCPEVPAG